MNTALGARASTWKPRLWKMPSFSGLVKTFRQVTPRDDALEITSDSKGAASPSERAPAATATHLMTSPCSPAPARMPPSESSMT